MTLTDITNDRNKPKEYSIYVKVYSYRDIVRLRLHFTLGRTAWDYLSNSTFPTHLYLVKDYEGRYNFSWTAAGHLEEEGEVKVVEIADIFDGLDAIKEDIRREINRVK